MATVCGVYAVNSVNSADSTDSTDSADLADSADSADLADSADSVVTTGLVKLVAVEMASSNDLIVSIDLLDSVLFKVVLIMNKF